MVDHAKRSQMQVVQAVDTAMYGLLSDEPLDLVFVQRLFFQWQLLQAMQLLLHAQIPLFIIWCDHPWVLLSF
jgi:hypothetical protein